MAGGVAANGLAQGQVNGARNGVTSAENTRQDRWDGQINDLNKQSLARYDGFSGKQDDRGKSVADYYKATGGALPSSGATTGVIPTSSSNVVVQEGNRANDKVAAFTDQQGKAQANLRSFGDVMGEASRGTALDTAAVGAINSQKQGSSAVVPLEYQAANNAGNGMKMFGDVLGGLGKAGMSAGLAGAGPNFPLFGSGAPVSATVFGPTQPGFFNNLFASITR